MPPPRTVLAVVAIFVGLSIWSWISEPSANSTQMVPRLVIGGLIVIGLVKGHPLAWHGGMVVPSIAVGWLILRSYLEFLGDAPFLSVIWFEALAAVYLAIPVLLHRDSSRAFFGFRCPSCGNLRTKAASLGGTVHRCPRCNSFWVRFRGSSAAAGP